LNTGGWLLLSVLFGAELMLVQRSERKRRFATALFMVIGAVIIWRYGLYRMGSDCSTDYLLLCRAAIIDSMPFQPLTQATAVTTINLAILTAVIFNIVFFFFFGRYNPPGSSDSIVVIGMQD
jgi:hypothetical protein